MTCLNDTAPEAVILAIGEEVLRGEVTNTNAAWLGAELTALGFRVAEHRAVADREEAIIAAFREATARAPLVLATGGLGPTGDDLTAGAAARFLGVELAESAEVLEAIAKRQGRAVAELSPGGRRMALVPAGSQALPNPCGAAPGIRLEGRRMKDEGRREAEAGSSPSSFILHPSALASQVFLLPGVPHEMQAIFTESVRPLLEKLFPGRRRVLARFWQIASWPESEADAEARKALADLLSPPASGLKPQASLEFGTLLGRGWVTLRATAEGPEAEALLAEADRRIRARFGDSLWSTQPADTLEAAAARELLGRGLSLALAESCTGGLIAARLVGIPGISGALKEGLVTYSNEAKVRLLGVGAEILMNRGVVSRECAEAMATGLRQRSAADITLAVTGIAGPEGGSAAKPVGTVFFAVAGERGVEADSRRLGGSRDWIRERAAAHGLWMLWKAAKAVGR